jgi:hypothetical protein
MNTTAGTTALTADSVAALARQEQPPCLSLYQSTHRQHPANRQDPIRFRNLVRVMAASLRQKYPTADAEALLKPFDALAHDEGFWNHTLDGLAVLVGVDFVRVFTLPRPVADLVVTADSFHTTPLRRLLQSVDRYQVLALNREGVRLFEGNRDTLDEVPLAPGVPRTIADALGEALTEPHQTVASYGGVGDGSRPMRHGHGGKMDEIDADTERFFRAVDRAVLAHHSRPSGLPLILAALPEHHHLFHQVSENPGLIAEGIRIDPGSRSPEEIRALAWQLMEPHYQARLSGLGAEFEQAHSRGLGSDDLEQIAQAAEAGRVATLLLEADRSVAGRPDDEPGSITQTDPNVDDALDDLAERVAKTGGRVLVIPVDQMPTRTGLAAIYRY